MIARPFKRSQVLMSSLSSPLSSIFCLLHHLREDAVFLHVSELSWLVSFASIAFFRSIDYYLKNERDAQEQDRSLRQGRDAAVGRQSVPEYA